MASPLVLTVAGGFGAQLNALAYSIYIRDVCNRKVIWKFREFAASHYTLVLLPLLEESGISVEIDESSGIRFEHANTERRLGTRINSFFLDFTRTLLFSSRVWKSKNAFLQEDLQTLNRTTRRLVGYYPDVRVFESVKSEIWQLLKNHPRYDFVSESATSDGVSIHWRMGDLLESEYLSKTHGIVDPNDIIRAVHSLEISEKEKIFVATDSPTIAQTLLARSLDSFEIQYSDGLSILEDLKSMTRFKNFIGTQSYISIWAALSILERSDSRILFPSRWFNSIPPGFEKYEYPVLSSRIIKYPTEFWSASEFKSKYGV